MSEIALENVSLTLNDAVLLDDVSMKLRAKELVALVGPNGAGKTTLLRCALGVASPSEGRALIDGLEPAALSPKERARQIAYLPQMRPLAWPILVKDVVALGRYAYGASVSRLKGEDADAVDKAIADCDLGLLANRNTDTLSGGELARVHCARAFAAKTPFLLADEPIASLDPRHQIETLLLLRRFANEGGGALIVLHDISLAARFCDRMIWMKGGRIVADGPPGETVTSSQIAKTFDVAASIADNGGKPVVTFG